MNVEQVWLETIEAGRKAGKEKLEELAKGGPQYAVVQHENPLDDDSLIVEVHGYMLDLCGFAWVHIHNCGRNPARQLVQYLRKLNIGHSGYRGGYEFRTRGFTNRQEISVNEAAMQAAATVLQKYGISAFVDSRLD